LFENLFISSKVKETFRYVRAPVDFEDVLLNKNNKTDDIIQQAYISVV
jgi:hypothetical protein